MQAAENTPVSIIMEIAFNPHRVAHTTDKNTVTRNSSLSSFASIHPSYCRQSCLMLASPAPSPLAYLPGRQLFVKTNRIYPCFVFVGIGNLHPRQHELAHPPPNRRRRRQGGGEDKRGRYSRESPASAAEAAPAAPEPRRYNRAPPYRIMARTRIKLAATAARAATAVTARSFTTGSKAGRAEQAEAGLSTSPASGCLTASCATAAPVSTAAATTE